MSEPVFRAHDRERQEGPAMRTLRLTPEGIRALGRLLEVERMTWRDANGDRWEGRLVK